MNKVTNLCLSLVLAGAALLSVSAVAPLPGKAAASAPGNLAAGSAGILPASSPGTMVQGDGSIQSFWEKFKAAIVKGDKVAVAGLSQFPITMPYGMPSVRTKAQLIRRYRDVFNHETNAAKCFGTARPETDPARPREFTVACKNAAGDEVIIYSFRRAGKAWAFSGLDNINE